MSTTVAFLLLLLAYRGRGSSQGSVGEMILCLSLDLPIVVSLLFPESTSSRLWDLVFERMMHSAEPCGKGCHVFSAPAR